MNTKNLVIIFVMILANLISFFLGGYYTLLPIMFLVGLVGASILSAWTVIGMETKDLVPFIAMATLVATIDEYAHTSAGTLTYFDNAAPSPLTVFGWSLFMILILTITKLMMKIHLLDLQNKKTPRILPVLISLILISTMVVLQGYVSVFNWVLVLVYVMLGLASFYYSYEHPLNWNLSLMTSSLAFGFYMEFTGALEGLWTFRFMEPVSLFIVFSWPLRTWAVNAFCLLFNVDFSKKMFVETYSRNNMLVTWLRRNCRNLIRIDTKRKCCLSFFFLNGIIHRSFGTSKH